MKTIGIVAAILMLAGGLYLSIQGQPIPLILSSNGAPTSGCGANQLDVDYTTGNTYSCNGGSWVRTNVSLGATNTWTAAQTFSGGGALSGTFTGSPTFSGVPVFSGGPSFTTAAATFGAGLTVSGGNETLPPFTITLPTGLLTTGTCAAASQVAITGVGTTSVILFDFASDPSGVVGYGSSGGLTLTAFGTSGNANVRQCNPTAGSITPGAMTLNVRAVL